MFTLLYTMRPNIKKYNNATKNAVSNKKEVAVSTWSLDLDPGV